MLSRDANQSRICSSQTLGSPKTSNFGADNDNTEIMFSHHGEDELKVMLSRFPHHMRPEFDKWIRIFVKEEIESSHKNEAMHITRRSNNFVLRNLELRITNITSPLLTGDHIEGIGGMPVIVTLVDSHTKEEVKSGPEASGNVEIVVTEAEIENEFECKLVSHMDGKKMNHVNRLPLKLLKGTAVFPRVSFAHTKDWMNMSTIRLQARFVDNFDGVHVKEAYTEPFLLKDRRTKVYKKHHPPYLSDEVWRLEKISKYGAFHKRLNTENIKTVKDFLVLLFLDPTMLRHILGPGMSSKMWEVVVEHATRCVIDDNRLYVYCPQSLKKDGVVFNVVGQVLGLLSDCKYVVSDKLSETEKAEAHKLVLYAFQHFDEVIPYDDESSLRNSICSFTEDLYPLKAQTMNENLEGNNLVPKGPFDYPQMNPPSPDIIQAILGEYGLDHMDSIDMIFDQPTDFECRVENTLKSDPSSSMHLQYLGVSSHSDLQCAVDGFLFPISSVGKAQRRWKIVSSVIKCFSFMLEIRSWELSSNDRMFDQDTWL